MRSRLHLVPRFRQKLAYPPAPTGRPFWVDDPAFNLGYHVRHSALPSPGLGGAAAQHGGARVQPEARPHEAALGAVDGPGADPEALRVRDQDPPRAGRRRLRGRHRDRPVRRQARSPSRPSPTATGSRARPRRAPSCSPRTPRGSPARRSGRCARIEQAVEHPRRALHQVSEAAEALGEVGWNFANPAPKVPLNVPVGSHRRFEWVRGDLAQFKRIKSVARRDRQRRRPRRRRRRDAQLAARARGTDRGTRAPRPGPGLDSRRGRARPARQPDRRGARADPGLRRRPGRSDSRSAARAWRGSSTRNRRWAPR